MSFQSATRRCSVHTTFPLARWRWRCFGTGYNPLKQHSSCVWIAGSACVCGGKSCGGYEGKDGVKIGHWAEGRKLANCGLIVECLLVHRDKRFNSLLSNTTCAKLVPRYYHWDDMGIIMIFEAPYHESTKLIKMTITKKLYLL